MKKKCKNICKNMQKYAKRNAQYAKKCRRPICKKYAKNAKKNQICIYVNHFHIFKNYANFAPGTLLMAAAGAAAAAAARLRLGAWPWARRRPAGIISAVASESGLSARLPA